MEKLTHPFPSAVAPSKPLSTGQPEWLFQMQMRYDTSAEILLFCLVTRSYPTLWDPMDCSPPVSSVHGDSPGKNNGVGCQALLQEIFPTQGSNPCLPHCRQILYHLSQRGSPSFFLLHWEYSSESPSAIQGPSHACAPGILGFDWAPSDIRLLTFVILSTIFFSGYSQRCIFSFVWTNLDSILKSRDITLLTKFHIVKAMVFPVVILWMWELDDKEGWALKSWCFWTVGLEKTLEIALDSKEIKPVNPKGNQPWKLIWRTYAEAAAPILWSPVAKSRLRKLSDAGKNWGQKRVTEDEMVG